MSAPSSDGPPADVGHGQPSAQDTGTRLGHDALAVSLSELARALQHEQSSEDVLARVVRAAIALIPGVEEGSISVVTARRHVHSTAPSSELPRQVDELQAETGEGPCLDAVFTHRTVRVSDMASEHRWPRFAPRALKAGAASMLSFQLYVEGEDLGALNLYSRVPFAFDDESEHIGLLFAAHAAIAYAAVTRQEQLGQSVESRDLIGQAKGILMERYKLTGAAAFDLLVHSSQNRNTKLRDVAEQLVVSGEIASTKATEDAAPHD